MRGSGERNLLVVAQVPPPHHGSNEMALVLIRALTTAEYGALLIDKSFSHSMHQVEKVSLRKIARLPALAFYLVREVLTRHPKICVYFIAAGGPALLVDACLLTLLGVLRVPYVLYIHGKGFRELGQRRSFWKWPTIIALRTSQGVIVPGDSLRNEVNWFTPDERVVCIPNCLLGSDVSQPRHPDSRIPVILYLSNLIPSKGALEFLQAARLVLNVTKDVRFVLAGDIWRESFCQVLKRYILENGLAPFVEMPGGVYGEEKEQLYAASGVFVFPSQREAFGLVNLEAMRAGIPVISSSEGAIPEVVQDGVTGFIVNPKNPQEIADRILQLIRDPGLRQRMGRAGRERFEKEYTFEKYVERWKQALHFFEKQIARKART